MPANTIANIILSSAYGPAAYTIFLTERGEVTEVVSAAARLPETVFQITYGERWEEARAYFQHLAALLPYQAEAAVVLSDAPAEFKALRKAFRDIEIPDDDAPHRRRVRLWQANPRFTPALFLQKKMPRALVKIQETLVGLETPGPYRELEPWLFALMPFLIDVEERKTLYQCLALMRSPTTREFLFGELERPGRHIYASVLLHSLRYYTSAEDLNRLLDIYPSIKNDGLEVDYSALLGHFSDPRVHDRLREMLDSFPHQARHILRDLKKSGHPAPYALVRARFDRETDGRLVDQLAELTADAPKARVTLSEMNAKMATPAFTDGPPVTWPQSLGVYWDRLVYTASAEELLAEVGKYLPRPEPRLQRNALLQLQAWAKNQKFPPALPPAIEDRLRELISARFDKIFTVALDVVAICMPSLAQPEAMVDALLQHSLVSRYRLMNAAALKKAAQKPGLRERQIAFLTQAVTKAADKNELDTLKRLLPYFNFLEVRPELEKLLTERSVMI